MPVLIQTDIRPIGMPHIHNMICKLHLSAFTDQKTLDVALYGPSIVRFKEMATLLDAILNYGSGPRVTKWHHLGSCIVYPPFVSPVKL